VATVVIAIFTIVLACVGNKQADVTSLAARATLSAELPMIFVQEIELREWLGATLTQTIAEGQPPEDCEIYITFHNYGRSVAILSALCLEYQVASALPARPAYKTTHAIPVGRAIERDQSFPMTPGGGPTFRLTGDERDRLAHKSTDLADLWVYGYLEFRDFRGVVHKTGFCFKWHSSLVALDARERTGFHSNGPPAYTYNT
jgi:hypothetical protein